MRLIPRIPTRRLGSEHGFSMIAVMGVMAASSLFVAVAFAASNGDLPLTRDSQDRKQAYAAAEAGINYYQFHLNQDPDYWTRCTNVPAPNGSENQPVNQAWNGTGTDPRRWRKVAGTPTEYTLELIPANGSSTCLEGNQTTMIDASTASFRIRATGRPRAGSKLKRSLIASFRRRSFLDFLYFTDYETTDPINYATSSQSWAQTNCANKRRPQRHSNCQEIQFADFDDIKGPFHTNDDILTCGTPTFGRVGKGDSIEFSGAAPGYRQLGSPCSGSPVFNGPRRSGVRTLTMPPTNTTLRTVAQNGGLYYEGKTTIRFNSGGDMTVINPYVNSGNPVTRATPGNGVIYVGNRTGGCGSQPPPSSANYGEPNTCGNLYVSGTYTKSMTLAAQNDIIVRPPRPPVVSSTSNNGDLIGSGNSVMGLIAQNFVRVYHPVSSDCDDDISPVMDKVRIDAAILSLEHSFTVDNHRCGDQLGDLTVYGAIAQKYRGPVGTSGGTGFEKDYNYDDRLRYRSPPFFLEPIAATWHVIRSNEQLPPR
jgi:hypothetical protein